VCTLTAESYCSGVNGFANRCAFQLLSKSGSRARGRHNSIDPNFGTTTFRDSSSKLEDTPHMRYQCAINVMVWGTILSQVFAAVYSYQAPDCGDIRDHFNQEVVFRFCVLMCMRPGHASIAAIILSITHAVLFVQYVPVAFTRLRHESCYAHLRTGD